VAPRITDLIRTDVAEVVEMSGRADLRAWWGAAGACGRAVVVPLAAAVARERLRAPPPAC
jgi:hypothetical protein